MDKEWIFKDRLSPEYNYGVECFLDFATQNANDKNKIKCPCTSCGNLKDKTIDQVRAHLFRYGMVKNIKQANAKLFKMQLKASQVSLNKNPNDHLTAQNFSRGTRSVIRKKHWVIQECQANCTYCIAMKK
ncbi:hypothetical protein ACS0TY_028652 [Phlomoides rotata]